MLVINRFSCLICNELVSDRFVWVKQLISTPFHPAFLTAERVEKAKKLKLALTAGIGSDHIDLPAAAKANITVAEITGAKLNAATENQTCFTCNGSVMLADSS